MGRFAIDFSEKFHSIREKFDEIERALSDEAVARDSNRILEFSRRHAELKGPVEDFARYQKLAAELKHAQDLLGDADLKEIAQQEILSLEPELHQMEERLARHLIPQDPDDRKNVYLEIRAGAGGEEAALFVGDLFRMYLQYAQRKGFSVELESESATGIGGYKEIVARISGRDVYGRFKYEGGTHRVQRVPDTEASGRIHTSTATVAIMPEVEDVDVTVADKDIRIDVFRSSGAGGQHVNKTSSAIRITHIPTGLVVQCQDERSQYKNKEKALKQLQAKLYNRQRQEKDQAYADQRRSMVGSGDRAEKIRTYNYPENRLTDHRIKLTLHRLAQILDGDLDLMIDALHTADQLERLKAL